PKLAHTRTPLLPPKAIPNLLSNSDSKRSGRSCRSRQAPVAKSIGYIRSSPADCCTWPRFRITPPEAQRIDLSRFVKPELHPSSPSLRLGEQAFRFAVLYDQ